jgi:hypothetical protein
MTDIPSLISAPTSTPGAPPTSSLDAARERAIRLLTDGFAYDVITVDEFEWRLGQLSHADSPRAIDALVADLGVPAHGLTGPTHASAPPAAAEGRILGIMSETRRMVTRRSSPPSFTTWCAAASTALCSMGVVTTARRPPASRARHTPMRAMLSASVPHEVNTTSSEAAPRHRARRSRASSREVRASRPQRWTLDGLPKRGPKKGCIASSTSARTGVVAA